MKYFSFIFILSFYSCQTENHELIYSTDGYLEDGSCYFSAKHEYKDYYTKKRHSRIIEMIEPEFINKLVKYDYLMLSDFKLDSIHYEIPIKESYKRILLKDKSSSSYLKHYETGFLFCMVNIPEETKVFSIDELQKLNYSISIQTIKKHRSITSKKSNPQAE